MAIQILSGTLVRADRPIGRPEQKDRLTSLLSEGCERVIILDQPKAVFVLYCARRLIGGLVDHPMSVFGRQPPQPAIVGPDGPVDANALLEHRT